MKITFFPSNPSESEINKEILNKAARVWIKDRTICENQRPFFFRSQLKRK